MFTFICSKCGFHHIHIGYLPIISLKTRASYDFSSASLLWVAVYNSTKFLRTSFSSLLPSHFLYLFSITQNLTYPWQQQLCTLCATIQTPNHQYNCCCLSFSSQKYIFSLAFLFLPVLFLTACPPSLDRTIATIITHHHLKSIIDSLLSVNKLSSLCQNTRNRGRIIWLSRRPKPITLIMVACRKRRKAN